MAQIEVHLLSIKENPHLLVSATLTTTMSFKDLGNSNYFVLMPRASFQRTTNATMVKDALVDLGIPAEVTERKDIAVEGLKISFLFIPKQLYCLNYIPLRQWLCL